MATGSYSRDVNIIDCNLGKLLCKYKNIHEVSVNGVAFTLDGKYLVTYSSDKLVNLIDIKEKTISR